MQNDIHLQSYEGYKIEIFFRSSESPPSDQYFYVRDVLLFLIRKIAYGIPSYINPANASYVPVIKSFKKKNSTFEIFLLGSQ